MTRSRIVHLVVWSTLAAAAGSSHAAEVRHDPRPEPELRCAGPARADGMFIACVMQEHTIPAAPAVTISGTGLDRLSVSGSVTVKGWNEPRMLLRARIEGVAHSRDAARRLAEDVTIEFDPEGIEARGPATSGDIHLRVTYEVFVPRETDVTIKARNGSLTAQDLDGTVTMTTKNGSLTLRQLAGTVEALTGNGDIIIEPGTTSERLELRGRVLNGGIILRMRNEWSGQLLARTANGSIEVSPAVRSVYGAAHSAAATHGSFFQVLDVAIGSAGGRLDLTTANGNIRIVSDESP